MRIIAGIFKGRKIKSPKGKDEIRPTTDRAKETVFNILDNRFELSDKKFIDLFCGTGSIGLEFLSRGGCFCTFVDKNITTVNENITILGIHNISSIVRSDAVKFLELRTEDNPDFIFADPPYNYDSYENLINKVSAFNSVFILEHDKFFITPDEYKENVFLQKKIGVSNFTFFDFKN